MLETKRCDPPLLLFVTPIKNLKHNSSWSEGKRGRWLDDRIDGRVRRPIAMGRLV